MRYKEKVIISGKIIEYFRYEKTLENGYKVNKEIPLGRAVVASDEERKENRIKVQQRARSTLRRLINANEGQWKDKRGSPYKTKFITLTFAENITSIPEANYEYKKFIQRLNWHLKYKAAYVVVVEFQQRGAVHYHTVFFNLPYIPVNKLGEIWGQGFIKVNAVEEVDNVGAYVSKYMGKELQEDKLIGQKCYFSSRGLIKPVEVIEKSQVESIITTLPETSQKYFTAYENEYTGVVIYRQYNLTKQIPGAHQVI